MNERVFKRSCRDVFRTSASTSNARRVSFSKRYVCTAAKRGRDGTVENTRNYRKTTRLHELGAGTPFIIVHKNAFNAVRDANTLRSHVHVIIRTVAERDRRMGIFPSFTRDIGPRGQSNRQNKENRTSFESRRKQQIFLYECFRTNFRSAEHAEKRFAWSFR